MLKTETFVIKNDPELTFVIKEVSLEEGLARVEKFDELKQLLTELNKREVDIVLPVYVNCLCATVSIEGLEWPLEYQEFLKLPQWLVDIWVHEITQLNPTWATTDRPAEKKIQRISAEKS